MAGRMLRRLEEEGLRGDRGCKCEHGCIHFSPIGKSSSAEICNLPDRKRRKHGEDAFTGLSGVQGGLSDRDDSESYAELSFGEEEGYSGASEELLSESEDTGYGSLGGWCVDPKGAWEEDGSYEPEEGSGEGDDDEGSSSESFRIVPEIPQVDLRVDESEVGSEEDWSYKTFRIDRCAWCGKEPVNSRALPQSILEEYGRVVGTIPRGEGRCCGRVRRANKCDPAEYLSGLDSPFTTCEREFWQFCRRATNHNKQYGVESVVELGEYTESKDECDSED